MLAAGLGGEEPAAKCRGAIEIVQQAGRRSDQ
jgi:hypothetical protein